MLSDEPMIDNEYQTSKHFKKTKTNITKKSSNGFALILTLWVLMIMSVLILTYTMSVNLNIKNASYLKDKIQASAYADGALYLAAVNLIPPDDKKDNSNNTEGSDKKSNSDSDTGSDKSTTGNSATGKGDSAGNSTTGKDDSNGGGGTTGSNTTGKTNPKQVEWFFKKLGKWYIDPKAWTMSKDKIENNSAYANENTNNIMLVCEIHAEDAKFPINSITQLKEMPTAAGISSLVFSAIKDYLKSLKKKQSSSGLDSSTKAEANNSQNTSSGSSSSSSSSSKSGSSNSQDSGSGSSSAQDSNNSQGPSSGAAKTTTSYGSFSCVEQLLEVNNVDSDTYDGSTGMSGLKDTMTVFSDGKIYINKAKEKVLAMIPGISSGAAGQMASQVATGNYLKSFDNLNSMIGANSADTSKAKKWLSLIPKYFRIRATAIVNGIMCTAECVAKVEKNNIEFVLMNRG